MRNVLLLILLISQLDARSQSLLLKDVNVVPMSSETVLSHQDVRIEGDRIVDIASAGSDLEADIVIHASGQYLIPGLAEMHAHIPVAEDGNDNLVRETLFLYLANGITTIRGMLGNPYHLDLKKQVNAFEFPAPRRRGNGTPPAPRTIPGARRSRGPSGRATRQGNPPTRDAAA